MTPVGQAIREIRQAKGLSQTDHAERVGVTPAYLSALEHGHRGVARPDMFARIVEALDIAPDEAARLGELNRISNPVVTIRTAGLEPHATELANRLAQSIGSLSDPDLTELLWILRHRKEGQGLAVAGLG